MKTLCLVRHAESASNAGLPTESPASNPITELGRTQATRFTDTWQQLPPCLIITSPYARAKETAVPFKARFPDVPTEEWPIHEWNQLAPEKYKGTTQEERWPHVKEYWERNDPEWCDGEGAESFAKLFERVNRTLMDACPHGRHEGTIVAFTHGHFMRAILWYLIVQGVTTADSMYRFRLFTEAVEIPNVSKLWLALTDDYHWTVSGRLSLCP